MNKKIYLLPLLMLALVFASCEETKEASRYDDWKARGENFIDSIAGVAAAQDENTPPAERIYAVLDQANRVSIYYKKNLDPKYVATSQEPVLYTDSVDVFYRVRYFNGDKVAENFVKENPDIELDVVKGFWVNSNIAGLTWALQAMKQGERWTLYIPWECAYGSGQADDKFVGTIEPYSTLIYDIMLVKVISD